MEAKTTRDGALSLLNVAIEAVNLAKEVSSITPAKAVFGSVSVLLVMIRVRFLQFSDGVSRVYVQTGFYDQQNRLRRAWANMRLLSRREVSARQDAMTYLVG